MFLDIFLFLLLSILAGGVVAGVTAGYKASKLLGIKTDTEIARAKTQRNMEEHSMRLAQHSQQQSMLALTEGTTDAATEEKKVDESRQPEKGKIDEILIPTDPHISKRQQEAIDFAQYAEVKEIDKKKKRRFAL